MTFEGTYAQMQEFLRRIRDLVRLMTVNEVTYCLPEGTPDLECPTPLAVSSSSASAVAQPGNGQKVVVRISAEVYMQPTGGPSGPSPVTPPAVEETTSETTSGETTGGG
jgi:type IV pilus assembly protein PilO